MEVGTIKHTQFCNVNLCDEKHVSLMGNILWINAHFLGIIGIEPELMLEQLENFSNLGVHTFTSWF